MSGSLAPINTLKVWQSSTINTSYCLWSCNRMSANKCVYLFIHLNHCHIRNQIRTCIAWPFKWELVLHVVS